MVTFELGFSTARAKQNTVIKDADNVKSVGFKLTKGIQSLIVLLCINSSSTKPKVSNRHKNNKLGLHEKAARSGKSNTFLWLCAEGFCSIFTSD